MKVWNYKSKEGDNLSKLIKKEGGGIVMTKPEMAKHLISLIEFEDGDVLLEPAKGDGAFFDNFPTNTINKWCEINEGVDFLNFNESVDYILCNPPFVPRKLFWEFNKKAMAITKKKIYWLINLGTLNVFTPKRLEEMTLNGWFITHLHIVSDRRWFGRYVWVEISKDSEKNIFTYHKNTF